MKIISPFKDFYDSALQFGQDDHVKYIRKTEERELPKILLPVYSIGNKYQQPVEAQPFLICGKIYHFYIDMAHKICDLLDPNGGTTSDDRSYHKFNPRSSENNNWLYNNRIDFSDEYLLDIHRQFKSPIITVQNGYEWQIRKYTNKIILNPRLNEYGIQKHFNPFILYQDIELFIDAYLSTQPEMVTISNNDKIVKAGFDTVASFRHRK